MPFEFYIYLVLLVICVVFVNSSFLISRVAIDNTSSQNNLLLIEQLTKFSNKPKNYRRTPNGYQYFGCAVEGIMLEEKANFTFKFPWIDKRFVQFETEISTSRMSEAVSNFGVHRSCFAPVGADYWSLQTNDTEYLKAHMNKDGFFFKSTNSYDYGINYNDVIRLSKDFSREIASFVLKELGAEASYSNCVIAALNFVQYIPYGQPEFDAGEYGYFGLSIPHESFVISYCDCDSKSVMLCGILFELLEKADENLILVYCTMNGTHHMIVGVHGLNFNGNTYFHNGREYLLLETTTPISLEAQRGINFENIHVYNLNYHG